MVQLGEDELNPNLNSNLDPPLSHRERKKARTRAALIEVSQRRFADHGYAQTTLDEICDEVDIRPQTLLRYFPSKAHLALAPMADPLVELRRYLEDPQRRIDTLTVWREYMRIEAGAVAAPTSPMLSSYVANLRTFVRWPEKDPVLTAMVSDISRQYRDAIAAGLAADRGLTADDLHSTLLAALLVTGRDAVYARWLDKEPDASLVDDQLAVLDYAVKSLPRRAARRLLSVGGA